MAPINPTPNQFPRTIYGIHDLEGAGILSQAHVGGWLVHTVDIGADAPADYTGLVNQGHRVIGRLNNGYGSAGTIPLPAQYDAFAAQVANWVASSKGGQIWIIGNEMNISGERPQGQTITPSSYATCFLKCRNAIHAVPGHANDQVIPGPVAPYNIETSYPGNTSGDWIKYFQDMLSAINGNLDGIAIHCYGRGNQPSSVTDETLYQAPLPSRPLN